MDQKIGDIYHRICFFFAYRHFYNSTVLLHRHAVDRKRQRHPLVFLHTAVIMGIQIRQICIFVKRILLYIQTGRVDMGSQNVHAVFQRFLSYVKKRHDLFHTHRIYFISGFDLFSGSFFLLQRNISRRFCLSYQFFHALSFCFSRVEKQTVSPGGLLQLLFILLCVIQPCVFSFHDLFHLSSYLSHSAQNFILKKYSVRISSPIWYYSANSRENPL